MTDFHFPGPRRLRWLLLILVSGLLLTELGVWQQRSAQTMQAQQALLQQASHLRVTLESSLNHPLQLSQALVAYVQARRGEVQQAELDFLLPNLLGQSSFIRNMGLAPDNRLRWVYPAAGNEQAIGLYYPDLPGQWPQIADMIARRQPQLTGPLPLAQGGRGLIYRIPVFLPDGRYWGIVSTVLNANAVWQFFQQQAQQLGLQAELHFPLPAAEWPQTSVAASSQRPPLQLVVRVAGSDWLLQVQAQPAAAEQRHWLRLFGYSLSLLLAGLTYLLLRAQQRRLQASQLSRQHEAYYRTVLEHVDDVILVVDDTQQVQTANQAAAALSGFDLHALQGMPLAQLLPGGRQQDEQSRQGQLLNAAQQLVDVEWRQTEVQLGTQVLTLMVLRDVTERNRVDRLKSEFISTVSHELRTPLTAIHAALSLVRSTATLSNPQSADTRQQLLDVAVANTGQLMLLVNDILDIERLQSGKLTVRCCPLPVAAELAEAVRRHQPLLAEKSLTLVQQYQLPADFCLALDQTRFQQVLANLLANAIRFSPLAGTIRLSAELIRATEQVPATGQSVLQISLSDTGPGVPAAFVPALFEQFSQADSSDSRSQQGSGLGLAICRQLLALMGGHIRYQDAPAGGACFIIEFIC